MRPAPSQVAIGCVWLLLGVWAALVVFFPDGNLDVWLHLRVGAEVAERGVPHVDSWSATARGRPFVAHEWLAGLALRRMADGFGGAGVVMLRVWVASLLALCLWLVAPAGARGRPLTLAVAALVLCVVLPRAVSRPHLFSLLFVALHVVALERWRRRRGDWLSLAWLAPLCALWANLHGAFLLGPTLLFVAGAAGVVEVRFPSLRGDDAPTRYREAALPLVVGLASCGFGLVNPYGAELYAFSLTMALENAYLKALVSEWKPPWAPEHRGSLATVSSLVLWIGCALGVVRRGRRAGALDVALLLFGTLLAARAVRFLPHFALLAYPIALRGALGRAPASEAQPPSWRRVALAALVPVTLVVITLVRGPGFHPTLRYPFRAELALHPAAPMVARARQLGLTGGVLNEYEIGGFLLYAAPSLPPAIDARIDIYGAALVTAWQRALTDPRAALAYVDEHDLQVAMLYRSRDDVIAALRSAGWQVRYQDEQHVLLARPRERAAL